MDGRVLPNLREVGPFSAEVSAYPFGGGCVLQRDASPVVTPFEGLTPAPDASEAQWAVTRMEARDDVGRIVPSGFDAVRRVLFPLGGDRRWADEWPEYLEHGDHVNVYEWPPIADVEPADDGRSIEASAVDALRPVLAAATTSPDLCHYGLESVEIAFVDRW